MDEDFEFFLKKMGPAFDRQDVPTSSIDRYRGKLPDQLLKYWQEHGWCAYADGSFWTVNPEEYESVLDAWIGDTPFMEQDAYHVIARGAFGHLYFWGEKTGYTLLISSVGSFAVPHSPSRAKSSDIAMQRFFGMRTRKGNDFGDFFAPALQTLGVLRSDEMYGFVPAIAMGGPGHFKHLKKLKAVEHLVFLAQLSELRVMKTHSSS
jgi:hypothetical protein